MNIFKIAIVCVAFLAFSPVHAQTQDTPPAVTAQLPPVAPPATHTTGLLDVGQAFSQSVAPFVNAGLQGLLALGLGWIAWVAKTKWGIDIDKQHQDSIQKWALNQASSLAADGSIKITIGPNGLPKVEADPQKLAQHAQQYAQQIPDAAAAFGLNATDLAAKIVDKLPQVPAVASMMAAPAKAA
jgi:hypothetical protein